MRASKLAIVLAMAMATGAAAAADADTSSMTSDQEATTGASGRGQFQAGERELYSEREKARLERQGFPQYNP